MAKIDYWQARVKYLEEALTELEHTYPKIVAEIRDRAWRRAAGHAGGVAYPRDRKLDDHDDPLYKAVYNLLLDSVSGYEARLLAPQILRLMTVQEGWQPEKDQTTDVLPMAEVSDSDIDRALARFRRWARKNDPEFAALLDAEIGS